MIAAYATPLHSTRKGRNTQRTRVTKSNTRGTTLTRSQRHLPEGGATRNFISAFLNCIILIESKHFLKKKYLHKKKDHV